MFKGKYFTVNGKACTTGSHSGCSNCLASSVIATSWVKSLVGMGTMSANNFPAQYVPDGSKWSSDGDSCYGFANFAHWYIFAQKNTDNLVSTLVATGSLTYATVSKAKPGDVIRFSNSWTSGHSVVFISSNSSGFKVLDCNYKDNATGKAACQVKVHTLSYESGGKCAITGVTNYDRESSSVKVTFNANGGSCSTASATVVKGGKLSSLPTPTRKGYTFGGWYTAASGGTKVTTSTAFSSNTTIYAHWTANTFTIVYDANGGSGSMANTVVTYDVKTPLRKNTFTRSGYEFVGWTATRASDGKCRYENADGSIEGWYAKGSQPDGCTPYVYIDEGWVAWTSGVDKDVVTMAAIWEKKAETNTAKIEVSTSWVMGGYTTVITVTLKNNPGISYLSVKPVYDAQYLTLTEVTNGSIFDSVEAGSRILFDSGTDSCVDGVLCRLTFSASDNAPKGTYRVELQVEECYNEEEQSVSVSSGGGDLYVNFILYGDANNDEVVDGRDVIRLRKYLANYNSETGKSTVDVFIGGDANGDGSIDGRDVIRLRKYLANYDSTTGSSTIKLGPSN